MRHRFALNMTSHSPPFLKVVIPMKNWEDVLYSRFYFMTKLKKKVIEFFIRFLNILELFIFFVLQRNFFLSFYFYLFFFFIFWMKKICLFRVVDINRHWDNIFSYAPKCHLYISFCFKKWDVTVPWQTFVIIFFSFYLFCIFFFLHIYNNLFNFIVLGDLFYLHIYYMVET